ncbi:putative cytochrome P450 oxidoreductase OrdA-like protein [Talaromyces proteolyticus]|uniref:Cytochrome P450 oxidoreductase OrdA-like protein n=1 Tax=Talaromyces proteolyticus TaxID=1131652 RepID=A0AAD4Q0P1_9EURO|nr:putative cytochrome P450 oxidoreductase OrdA-like protein [Talaromyces proteolyticus]KAH8704710.1 putative cytochrome P450 oxidoreductase OrdA-like protein [Talaromyces proteolyticus]
MSFMSITGAILTSIVLYFVYTIAHSRHAIKPPLPPGPRPKFLVGNLADLPKPGEREWEHWLKHKDLYGGISSITVLGQTLVIIHDIRLAYELMEKRSAKHSCRPKQVFAGELLGWNDSLGLATYGNRFRAIRKNMAKVIGSHATASQFYPLQELEAGRLLLRILDSPENLKEHIQSDAISAILKIIYGYNAEAHQRDPLVRLANEVMDEFAQAGVPGAWMVDMIPALKHIPDWFPGAGFKRTARSWAASLWELSERPFAFVRYQMDTGVENLSFLSQLLQKQSIANPNDRSVVKWSALSLVTAGADTTQSSLRCFFLAMTLYPEVQRKAQEEIDRVVGFDRLPELSDRPNLPYINAVVKEIFRWHPVAPMSLPHTTTEDDIIDGYLIPKGAYIMPSIWYFTHDPSVYSDPMSFKPERHLAAEGYPAELDPETLVFGFGRRICPGRLLASSSIFINVARSLAVFKITNPIENGVEVKQVAEFMPGVVSHPAPYKPTIKARSAKHEALVREIEQKHPWQQADSKIMQNVSF